MGRSKGDHYPLDVTSWEIAHRTLHGGSAEHERPHEVPPGYGEDRIALLVRDPWCVFAFWEVTEAGWREAVGRLPPAGGHPRLVLRLFDVTGHVRPGQSAWSWSGNNGHTDVVVDGADHWYIHLERPGRAVAAEIGPARAQAFVPIARSNAVITPPGGPTGDLAQWLLSPGERAVSIPAAPALRVDAELVVFGRVSDPRTRVLVGGQPVEVGADGSFRFRCSLPDGTIVVPVEACFSDGARRAVTPVVSRETY